MDEPSEAGVTSQPTGSSGEQFQSVFWSTKRAMWEANDGAYRAHGVREGQQFILMCLWEQDGQTPGQIAKQLGLATPTVTKAATRMEASGLLSRQPDQHDRRLVRLHLTERGHELKEILDREMRKLAERALATLSEAERAALIRALTQIRHNLSSSTQGQS
ncbi:MarR family winged helix-turn-helix transcriptional regulator [Flindersiella endophytica]